MNNFESNMSDNSLNKSVARSSSGVSTQQSADGIDAKEQDCQILYGNCFTKFPHPEILNDQSSQLYLSDINSYLETCSINDGLDTVGTSRSTKSRRFSEAPTFGKFRFGTVKKKDLQKSFTIQHQLSANHNESKLNRLCATLTSITKQRPPFFFDENTDSFYRNPDIPLPTGEPMKILETKPSNLPLRWSSLEEALDHHANHSPKTMIFCTLDHTSQNPHKSISPNSSLTYHKLQSKATKVAYHLLYKLAQSINKTHFKRTNQNQLSASTLGVTPGIDESSSIMMGAGAGPGTTMSNLRVGQSVALLFSADWPADFLIALFGCVIGKLVAVPVEMPDLTCQAGVQQCQTTGKYLTQLSVTTVLTSTECYRELTKKGVGADIRDVWPWNELVFVNIDTLYQEKISKSFIPPQQCSTFEAPLYVEFSLLPDPHQQSESLYGLPVTMPQILEHCRSLEHICDYQESQSILCTDDIRRGPGLWHAVFATLYCGMTAYYWPTNQIKKSPSNWLNTISKLKITNLVTNSRALHQTLELDQKQISSINLSCVKNLLVSDASVPWINETLDHFISKYSSTSTNQMPSQFGLAPSSILSCVSQPQSLSICMSRRFSNHNETNSSPSSANQIKLSLDALSYRLLKQPITNEEAQLSICVESSGQLLPGMRAVCIPIKSPIFCPENGYHSNNTTANRNGSSSIGKDAVSCHDDELGEICVASAYSNRSYWITPDHITNQYLSVNPCTTNGDRESNEQQEFQKTGLVGFFREEKVFIIGSLWSHLLVNGRLLNSDDLVGTVSAVHSCGSSNSGGGSTMQHRGVLYKARCCTFTVLVLNQPQLVIAMEIHKPVMSSGGNSEAEYHASVYSWLTRVLHSVISLHGVTPFCLVGLPPNSFPKTLLGDINVAQTRHRFLNASLSISYMLLAPQSALANVLPYAPRPSSATSASIVAGTSQRHQLSLLAHTLNSQSFATMGTCDDTFLNNQSASRIMTLPEVLEWRAAHTAADPVLSIITGGGGGGANQKNSVLESLTYDQLQKKAEKIAGLMKEKCKIPIPNSSTTYIAIMTENLIEQICALYACYFLGVIPLILNSPIQLYNSYVLSVQHGLKDDSVNTLNQSGSVTNQIVTLLLENLWACKHSNAIGCLVSNQNLKLLKSKDISRHLSITQWNMVLIDLSDSPRHKFKPTPQASQSINRMSPALARIHGNPDSSISLVTWSHNALANACESVTKDDTLYPNLFEPQSCCLIGFPGCHDYTQPSLLLVTCILSVYSGYHAILPHHPSSANNNPLLWMDLVSQKQIKLMFCSESLIRNYFCQSASTVTANKKSGLVSMARNKPAASNANSLLDSLQCVVVCASPDSRTDIDMLQEFQDSVLIGSRTGKSSNAGAKLTVAMEVPFTPGFLLQIPRHDLEQPIRITNLDKSALIRNTRVTESQDMDQIIRIPETGQPISNNKVIVVDAETRCQRSTNQIGELWIQSNCSADKILASTNSRHVTNENQSSSSCMNLDDTVSMDTLVVCKSSQIAITTKNFSKDELEMLNNDKLNANLVLGDSLNQSYIRTELIGYIRNYGSDNSVSPLVRQPSTSVSSTTSNSPLSSSVTVLGHSSSVTLHFRASLSSLNLCVVPNQLENLLENSEHKFIKKTMIFCEDDLLVGIVEVSSLSFSRYELCLRMLPQIQQHILEFCNIPLSVLCFVYPGQLTRLLGNWNWRRLARLLWRQRQLEGPLQFYCL